MLETSNLYTRPITLAFISILLFSFGILIQNVFADGVQPGSCNNEYDGPITNATIIAENKAYYPLNNSVSFQLPFYKSYYLTFTVKTPGINDQGNSLPGNVWIDQDYQGFTNSGCYGTAYPNQNFTVNETISHATSTSVFWATEVSGFSYTVNWLYPPSAPQNLQASAGNSQVTLSWTVVNSGRSPITNYNIYRSTSSGAETLLSTAGNVTSYTDTGLANGQTYFYKLTAVSSVGESSQSNEASATPAAPSDATVKTISVGNQTLGGIGVNSNTNKIYVTNFGNCSTMWSCSGSTGTTVSVIDGLTDNVTKTIAVGNLPLGVGVNPITNKIYVSNVGSSTVSVIDGSTNTLTNTIKVGSAPIRVAVNPSTDKIYVANYVDQTVSVIDGSTDTVTSTFVVGSRPTGIDINDNTNIVYVTNNANTLLVIDGSTNSIITTISLKQNPWDVKVNPVTNMVYVRAIGDDCSSQCVPVGVLYAINGATNTLVTTVPNLDPQLSGLVVNPVAINPVTNSIYATEYDDNTVSVIDGKTNGVVNSIPVGNHPNAVVVNPVTNKIYVTNQGSNTVSVIDGNNPSLGIYPGWQSCCYGMLSVNGMVQNPIAGINQLQVSIFAPNGTLVLNKTESTRGFQVDYLMHRSDGAGNYTIIGTYAKMSVQKQIPSFITGNATISIGNSFESLSDGTVYTSGLATNAISAEKISISISNSSNTIVASNVISINNHAQYLDILGPLSTAGNYTVTATFLYNGATAKYHLAYVCATSNCVTPAIPSSTTTTITISSNKTIPDNPFTLTATVLPSSATGTIQFQVDGTNLETPVTLSGGTARMTTSLPTGTHDITASYSGDSNFAPSISGQYTITVQTPALATQNMIIIVNNMTLTQGTTKSLDAKLDATISYLNANDTYDARNTLQSFISEVNAQTGKRITQEQANQLVVTARNIIKAIQ